MRKPTLGAGLVLPDDIWQCVACFIPHENLPRLISVNRAFYNIILDAKYSEVFWAKLDGPMLRSLVLLRNPSIAKRVRRLHVRAWFIEYLLRKDSLYRPSYVVCSKRWVARHIRLPSTPIRLTPSSGGSSPAVSDVLLAMTEAARLMTFVTEYSFEWRDLSPTSDTLLFLQSARTAFGSSLRKLTLHAQLRNFRNLLSTVDFDNLEELELNFDHDQEDPVDEKEDEVLANSIAPFINHFRRTIGTLVISSASKTDLSSLFRALQPFPHLRKLVVRLSFDDTHLSDPRGLVQVLRTNQDTLSNVELGRSFGASAEGMDTSTWPNFSKAILSDREVLLNLNTLKTPILETFSHTMTCLHRSANTLTSLSLVHSFLKDDELAALVDSFAHRDFDTGLKYLQTGVTHATPAHFDLLASRLPGLVKLTLVVLESSMLVASVLFDIWDGLAHGNLAFKLRWQCKSGYFTLYFRRCIVHESLV
ncbi:hypothetical protein B0H10DRAFT_15101 [Mycena sp. CBHHK59/15]|nr:hypothetical protein B0H10DRAFT_15101 [Mycena sp. CBHHK59/15]